MGARGAAGELRFFSGELRILACDPLLQALLERCWLAAQCGQGFAREME